MAAAAAAAAVAHSALSVRYWDLPPPLIAPFLCLTFTLALVAPTDSIPVPIHHNANTNLFSLYLVVSLSVLTGCSPVVVVVVAYR